MITFFQILTAIALSIILIAVANLWLYRKNEKL